MWLQKKICPSRNVFRIEIQVGKKGPDFSFFEISDMGPKTRCQQSVRFLIAWLTPAEGVSFSNKKPYGLLNPLAVQ